MSKKFPRGKEYIMLLPDKMSEEGFAVAKKLRIIIEKRTFIQMKINIIEFNSS